MKHSFQLKICAFLLTILVVGCFWHARAAAENDKDGWVEEDDNIFFFDGGRMLHGCIAEIDGEYYFFRNDGTLLKEDETFLIEGRDGNAFWIRAGWDNVLIAGDWYTDESADPAERYYYGDDFAAVCGPAHVDDTFYLFDKQTGRLLCNRILLMNGAWWESDFQGILSPISESQMTGKAVDGWITDTNGDVYFYLDGKPMDGGFYEIDGEYRFFHDDGRMAKDESLYLDSHWVHIDKDGRILLDSGEDDSDSSSFEAEDKSSGSDDDIEPNADILVPGSGTNVSEDAADPGTVTPSIEDSVPGPDDTSLAEGSSVAGTGETSNVEDTPVSVIDDTNTSEDNSAPLDGWVTIGAERYYYRNRKPISAGRHYIEWKEYYFDENGRLLHDCIVDDHVLDSIGCVVQSGMVVLRDHQYYVNPTTHLIEKNTEVNTDSVLYLADADGRLQQKPLPAEPGTESATESSRTDESFRNPQSSSDPDADPDPDADYVPMNETDSAEQEALPVDGSIRYSDNYLPGEMPAASSSAPASPATDNPSSGILFWRGSAWQEMHGSAEKPIRIHIYGQDAAILDNGTVLRDAFVYSAEGVFGFDRDGNALPEGFAARYGKLFYVTAPDPNAEMLVLLMS